MNGMSWSSRHCQTLFNYITGLVRETGLLDLAAEVHNKCQIASTTNIDHSLGMQENWLTTDAQNFHEIFDNRTITVIITHTSPSRYAVVFHWSSILHS